MIDIVINNFRRLQYLNIQVRAIKQRTDFPYRIIVVDNASTPKTKAFVKKLIKEGLVWKAVYNDKNYTLPQSLKRGVELVENEYCILTTDDVMPPWSNPCWLTHLDHLIRVNKDYGAICFRHGKSQSEAYIKQNINKINVSLSKELNSMKSIEEFLQIVKTEDLRYMMLNHRTGKIEQLGFGKDHTWIRTFARRLKWFLNKRVGKPPVDFPLRSVIWRDENLGYEKDLSERGKFEII